MVNLLSSNTSIYLGTIGKNYISLKYNNGDQEFSINQPNTITSMEMAKRENNEILILIATKDEELRIYYKNIMLYFKNWRLYFWDEIWNIRYKERMHYNVYIWRCIIS